MSITLYGIPTCGSCKKARAWLANNQFDYTWVDVRKTPPSREQIASWIETLTAKPMRNTSGGSYRALGPEKKEWNDTQWLDAFTDDPMLLKRPLLEKDGTALGTGFKEENWKHWLCP